MVRAGTERYGIPLPAVREVTMLTPSSYQRMGERSILHIGEEAIEVQPLQQLLYRSSVPVETGKPVVIVRTAAGMIGMLVDELLGRQEIVIKPLGSFKSLDRSSFGGATIDPEGRVVLCWILLDCWRERHKLLRHRTCRQLELGSAGSMGRTQRYQS
jgi:Chemotaxis protein histidine kinase and related kinases